jgi:hypothetical protein
LAAVLKEDEDRTDFVRAAIERELAARGAPAAHDGPRRARAPPERRVRVERHEPLPVDTGEFAAALSLAATLGKENPPALTADLRPSTRFPTRWTSPVERGR